jgi:chorismate lyase/3-hydroxybenzoate synthase
MRLPNVVPLSLPERISWVVSGAFTCSPAGGFYFGEESCAEGLPDGVIPLDMPVLDTVKEAGYEIWLSGSSTTFEQLENIRFVRDGAIVFGYISLPEPLDSNLEKLTYSAYVEVLQFVRSLGSYHLWRLWNYFPGINELNDGLERYRVFNIGRQRAYDLFPELLKAGMPAASAIGVRNGGLSVAFLAGSQEPQLLENPRQISAFKYPEQYGPRSPSFSRAGLINLADAKLLLVSGTASIVGHETLHGGDPYAQTLTSLENIRLVVKQAEQSAERSFPLDEMLYRVYVRNDHDCLSIKRGFADFFDGLPKPKEVHYVLGDICRRDLLVEIEASGCFG